VNSTVMTIFNQLTGQYSGSIAAIQSGSIVLGKELFNCIALLSVGLLGINRLLNKNVDMVESNIELIRWLVYLNVFYLFITEYDQFLPLIINSFQQAGAYLGGQASSTYTVPTPAGIISNGFNIALQIVNIGFKQSLFLNFAMDLISIFTVIVILYCFGMIAVELLLIQIGSQIILAGGIFLLAFSGLQWTRDYAERYVHTFFHIGVKMLFMYVLIGVGGGLTDNWASSLKNIPNNLIFQYFFAMVMATFVFFMLCQKVPAQAAVYLTGRLSMNFDAVPSLPDVVKGVAKTATSAVGGVVGIVGMTKAVSVASQVAKTTLESQGKKANLLNTGIETIKTLGTADKAVKQEAWDRKVDDTKGGKIAKNISDSIPKPKKNTKRKTETDFIDDPMDFSI
jgi:type IV secretion system protein TrbL